MAVIVNQPKPLSTSPLKLSPPLGAALAFMGMEGSMPLFHGSQGCTAFALVMMVRHFREAIPLQTTAMNEVSVILGGMDQVEEALLNIARRTKPKVIGLITTALTEVRGEDVKGDLGLIKARQRDLAEVEVVPVSAPDFDGSLETGWAKAVEALVVLAQPARARSGSRRVNVLPGCHLTAGDLEHLKEIIEAFDLDPVVVPDLSGSLDGHLPDAYMPTTLGGAAIEQVRAMGQACFTIAIGEHMRRAADLLQSRTGVPSKVFDRLTGLEAVDNLMVHLSAISGRSVPMKLKRQRSQLVDAMLDGHFFFGAKQVAVAAEPDLLATIGRLVTEMGASLACAVSTVPVSHLADLPCARVVIGDLDDLDDEIAALGGVDLVVANANARQLTERHGVPLVRMGFPIFDRLGAAHRLSLGYRGTRDLIFELGNILLEAHHHHSPEHGHGQALEVD